jgi:hypothetical protein
MWVRAFALILGLLFLLSGIAGFVPRFLTPTGEGNPLLFGLFPTNSAHNLVHAAWGVWGIVAFGAYARARLYARITAVVYFVLAVMGLILPLSTVFGLMPVYGYDVWLHLLIAILAAIFGFARIDGTDIVRTS